VTRTLAAAILAALILACSRESTPAPVQADPEEIACAESCAGWGGLWTGGMCDTCAEGVRSCMCWEGDESDTESRERVCGNLRAWQGCGEWVGR
jgi:hypothetical protein